MACRCALCRCIYFLFVKRQQGCPTAAFQPDLTGSAKFLKAGLNKLRGAQRKVDEQYKLAVYLT